jgi:hypothetical protein
MMLRIPLRAQLVNPAQMDRLWWAQEAARGSAPKGSLLIHEPAERLTPRNPSAYRRRSGKPTRKA